MPDWRECELTITGPGRVEARFGESVVRADHPPDDDREGRAPEPWLLFLASVGTCAASFVEDYLAANGLPSKGITLVQRQDLDSTERIPEIEIEVRVPPGFPAGHRKGLVEAASACTVKRVIESPPRFRIRVSEIEP